MMADQFGELPQGCSRLAVVVTFGYRLWLQVIPTGVFTAGRGCDIFGRYHGEEDLPQGCSRLAVVVTRRPRGKFPIFPTGVFTAGRGCDLSRYHFW